NELAIEPRDPRQWQSQIRSRRESCKILMAEIGTCTGSSGDALATLSVPSIPGRTMKSVGSPLQRAARQPWALHTTLLAPTAGNSDVPTSLFGRITTTRNWKTMNAIVRVATFRRQTCQADISSELPIRRLVTEFKRYCTTRGCTGQIATEPAA